MPEYNKTKKLDTKQIIDKRDDEKSRKMARVIGKVKGDDFKGGGSSTGRRAVNAAAQPGFAAVAAAKAVSKVVKKVL